MNQVLGLEIKHICYKMSLETFVNLNPKSSARQGLFVFFFSCFWRVCFFGNFNYDGSITYRLVKKILYFA